MLESALQQRGLSLSVHAAPFRNRDNEASVAFRRSSPKNEVSGVATYGRFRLEVGTEEALRI